MARETIVEAAIRLLRAHRTRSTAQLAAHMKRQGISRAADPAASVVRQLRWEGRFHRLADDRWILLEVLLAVPATHRLTPEEVASNTLAIGADLAHLPSSWAFQPWLAGGKPVQALRGQVAQAATGLECGLAVRGPAGWLGHPAGTLVQVTASGGVLRIEPASSPPASARLRARRLVESTRRVLGSMPPGIFGEPVTSIGEVLLELLADDPDFMAEPLPPFGELFEGTGLEVHRAYIGRAGRDWSRLDESIDRARARARSFPEADGADERPDFDEADATDLDLDGLEVAFDDLGPDADLAPDHVPGFDDATLDNLVAALDMDEDEAKTLGLVLDLYVVWRVPTPDGTVPSESRTMRRNVAQLTCLDRVALALAEYAWTDTGFESFVVDLRSAARGSQSAGPEFLLGACAEVRGSVEEAEGHFRASLAVDPDFVPARLQLYRSEIDRGNYAAALGHLRTLGAPADDPWRAWLDGIVQPAYPPVGRNDPCPCGSGRKFKTCHLGRPAGGTAPGAADALFRKLSLWVERSDVQRALVDLVHEVVGEPHLKRGDAGAPHSKAAAAAEELLMGEHLTQAIDVLLFDRGWFDRLVAAHGPLLPAAERSLAETWRSTRRGLYEVVEVHPGSGASMRDIVADTPPVEVADRSLSRTAHPLDLVLLRLRPDVDGRLLATDGSLVPRSRRAFVDELVRSKDAIGQLRWIALPQPAPRLQNMEGEPILLVTASYRLPDPDAAHRGLTAALHADEGGVFTERVIRRGREWMRGTIAVVDDTATVSANSRKRADRLVRTLLNAAPAARLIKREERGPEEAVADLNPVAADGDPAAGKAVGRGEFLDPAEHPELQEALDRLVRDFERRWVDERIPALGGRTPREALRDGAGRRELLALLDDMEWQRRQLEGRGAPGILRRSGASSGTAAPGAAGAPGAGMDPDRIRALLGLSEADRRP